ncbi:outer membrane lipoprotein carrier protein LolA [Amycolatopsis minnesotensis]|uniref:Sigma-E factor regulatory protein RseB domain-containing protein n=1 Tax=Amycolatopsis minnesotensis TaxID=337894 RepID=A0ABN2R525_9PSEU
MNPKKKALAAAAVGTAAGVAGLAIIAMPADAGEAPELPAVSAEELVQSVITTPPPALNGSVKLTNNLGLPVGLPGTGALTADSARVFTDGQGHSKITTQKGAGEQTVVHNGSTVWTYNSGSNTATKTTLPAGADGKHAPEAGGQAADPAAIASKVLGAVRESSTVSVEGTANVAGRAAYELVLTPKPTERTLLREVRVAVDAEKRLPLELSVLSNGSPDPALQVGFTDVSFTPQAANLFEFTPPAGAKVTEQQPKIDQRDKDKAKAEIQQNLKTVGTGWDTVLVGQLPADALSDMGKGKAGEHGRNVDPKAILDRVSKPVSGAFGTGHVVTTKVGTALLTDDGRVAAGFVPEQVLVEALGTK